MTQKLVFVADLGRLKAYRLEEGRQFSHPRLQLVDDWQTGVVQHLSAELADQAGQFRKGVPGGEGPSALSDGEVHNLDLERRRRALKALAHRIEDVLSREKMDGFYLAADSRINQPLLNEMNGAARARVQKNVVANLSKLGPAAVLDHFCE